MPSASLLAKLFIPRYFKYSFEIAGILFICFVKRINSFLVITSLQGTPMPLEKYQIRHDRYAASTWQMLKITCINILDSVTKY